MLGGAAGQAMQALEKSLFDCSDASAAAWSNCDATFGEYKACLDAEFAEHLKYWDSLSCEQHGAAAPVLTLTPRSPQCQTLFERCASE